MRANNNKLPKEAFGIFVAFGLCTLSLLWASDNEQRFAIALTCFWLVGTGGYWYIRHYITPIIQASGNYFIAKRYLFRFERLMITARHMLGTWQWHRIYVAGCLIILVDAATFSHQVRAVAAIPILVFFPDLDAEVATALVPDICIGLFVAITELWIWSRRLLAKLSIWILKDLHIKYLFKMRNEPE